MWHISQAHSANSWKYPPDPEISRFYPTRKGKDVPDLMLYIMRLLSRFQGYKKWQIAKMERAKLLQTRSLHFISWISSRRKSLCFIIQMMNNLKRLAQIHANSFHPKGLSETRLTLHPEWKSSSTTSHSKAFHWAHDKSHHSAIKIMAQGVLNATVQRVQRVRWTSGSSKRFYDLPSNNVGNFSAGAPIWGCKCFHCRSQRFGALPALDCMEVCSLCVDCCHSLPTVPGIPHEAALSDRFFGSN